MQTLRERFTKTEWEKLEHRATRVATDVKETDSRQSIGLMVTVINGETYGISGQNVQAVHSNVNIFALPNVPPHIAGLANLRGTLTSVLQMQIVLNLDYQETHQAVTLIELQSHNLALQVDDVIGIQDYFLDTLEVLPDEINGAYTRGVFGDGTIFLDINLILNDPTLVVDQ